MSEIVRRLDVEMKAVRRALIDQRKRILHLEGQVEALKRSQEVLFEDHAGIVDDLHSHKTQLSELIRQSRQSLREAQNRLQTLEGELEGFTKARELLVGESSSCGVSDDIEPSEHRGREISRDWRKILGHFLKVAPNPMSIDDIMGFINKSNMVISRNAVRSQLHIYCNRGFLKRVSDGHYRATDAIKRIC